MAHVQKTLNYTATIQDHNGDILVEGEVPKAWTDVVGVLATVSSTNAMAVRATVTTDGIVFRFWGAGGNTIPRGVQVSWTFTIHGTTG